jgi:AcrR family transcriptional regulator
MQVNQYSIRFIEKGLAGVSMSMIADKIGIKKPSLYKHFSSKDEIVEAMY